jgi:DNA-binding NtrC family response regulator
VVAVSEEIQAEFFEKLERSFAEGKYAEARRIVRRFTRQKMAEKTRAQAQFWVARSYGYEGRWKKAVEVFEEVVERAQISRDFETVCSMLNYIGDCHIYMGDMARAVRYYKRSLRICEQKGISGPPLARNISDLAQVAEGGGQYKEALSRWEETARIYRALPPGRENTNALLNIAKLKSRLGEIDAGIADAREALSMVSGLERRVAAMDCLWVLGSLHVQKGEYRDGLHYLEQAIQESGGVIRPEFARAHVAYTGALIEIGAFAKARQYGEEALAAARKLKWKPRIATCHMLLARVRLAQGDTVAALRYAREAKRLFNSARLLIGKAAALLCETEALTKVLSFNQARKALKEALAIASKTDDILLKSNCVLAQTMILIVKKRPEEPTARKLHQFCEQLKTGWRHQYIKVKYHLAALLMLDGKLEDASNMAEELLEESRSILDSLPEEYCDSYRNHALAKAITELVLKLQMEKTLQSTSIDNVTNLLEVFRRDTSMGPQTTVRSPGGVAAPTKLIYDSDSMREVLHTASRVARTGMPLLITGETGVGKEMVARCIHDLSGRKGQFVPLNCVAIPSSLVESELFGYVKGAFTGAHGDKKGLFLAANNGTLFLDEIGEMSAEMQAKLLRVLEDNSVRPLGATEHVSANVRLVCATNSDLKNNVARGRFREDLFYRVNVVAINIPPLRQRREDIPVLIEHFLKEAVRQIRVEKNALDALVEYEWPGNVRELKNEVARLLATAEDVIERRMLKDDIISPHAPPSTGALQEMERKMIQEVLRKTGHNTKEAAKLLGIARSTLYEKIKRYKIERMEF